MPRLRTAARDTRPRPRAEALRRPPASDFSAAVNGEAAVGSSSRSRRLVAMPISSSRPGEASCGGSPRTCRSCSAASSADSIPSRRLGRAQLLEPRDEIVQVSTACRVRGHLAQRRDGHGLVELGPARNGLPSARTASQLRRPASSSKAQRYTRSPESGLGGNHPRHLAARSCAPARDRRSARARPRGSRRQNTARVVENGPRPRAVRTPRPLV